ncbi:MAG: DUF3426 domain-containing protein [Anaerolineae bacterium]|nr:DUF3426 domain-containing protein [Anaerolineae bacterium]
MVHRHGLRIGGLLAAVLLGSLLVGCSSGTVVVVATPAPPDANFQTYAHPTGAFSIRLPPDWAVNDLSTAGAVYVEFSPPGAFRPPLTAYLLNTGAPLTADAFEQAVTAYTNSYHPDQTRYVPQDRVIQADGSWLVPALLRAEGRTQQLNTFFAREGPLFAVLEVLIPEDDPALLDTLDAVVDTFVLDPAADLSAGQIVQRAVALDQEATGVVAFAGLYTWTDSQGGFHINGQVVNNDVAPLEFVRVTARLFDAADNQLAELSDFAAADVLQPGQYAPFSVQFVGGRSPAAVRYELHAAARHAGVAAETYYGPSNFAIADHADFNERGHLSVSGTVTNTGPFDAHFVKITITLFDDQGRVVATDTAFTAQQQLAVGQSADFQVTFFELGGGATRYLAIAQATLE